MKFPRRPLSVVLLATATLVACVQVQPAPGDASYTGENQKPQPTPHKVALPLVSVPNPLDPSVDPLETAKTFSLPEREAQELAGLENVFALSPNIISGTEPHGFQDGQEGLKSIAALGVKTILSVDGKVPDAEAAAALGMRYVHIPIQYSGMDDEQVLNIAKTFRELEGPFYVHCFHGVHRGPAAAAIGRMAIDGVPREQALAEMRQWCGTAEKYTGLYDEVAFAEVPSAAATSASDFDFPSSQQFEGVRAAMVPIARHFDEVKYARRRGWTAVNPDHPDVVPAQEALKLSQVLTKLVEMQDYHHEMPHSDEVQSWFEDGQKGSVLLASILSDQTKLEAQGIDWKKQADDAYRQVAVSCKACHKLYRD